jgi:cell division protein YceG involved in septum cleavage
MKQIEISAKDPKSDKSATITVNYADTVEEAVQMFGEEAILSNAMANWRVTLQANIRNSLKAGHYAEEIAEKLSGAKMGVATTGTRMDATSAFIAKFRSATPEGQAELLNMLRTAAQG